MNNTFLYIITVLIWGSTWLSIEYQLGVVAAEVSVFYRYVLASSVLFVWSVARRLPLRFDRSAHFKFVQLGLLLFSLNYICAYHAQRYVPSALIAVSFSMLLWMNIVNAWLFFRIKAGANVLFGALLGVCGIALMFWPSIKEVSFADATIIGALFGIAGAYIASLGNMVSLVAQRERLPIVQSNAWGMFYGAVFTGLIAAAQGHEFIYDWSISYSVSLFYLSIFGSVIAFGAYLKLLGQIGAHKAGYATVLFPVVALILSVLFEGLELNRFIGGGALLALTGNYFVMRRVVQKPGNTAVP